MLNPNIEMLENLISAAVSTRYKEVPPTEEEFLTLAQSMRATLSTLPVTDEEFAEILVRLRASIVIQMDVGVYINDRNTPHKSWLPSRRADLDFFFWNRYKKYLEEIKHWQGICKLNICRFIGTAERGHKHFFFCLGGILDIGEGFAQRAFNRFNLCNRHISFSTPFISSISS